jgi:hypothetical protein
MAGVFHRKGRLSTLQDCSQADQRFVGLGAPVSGGPPTHVEVVEPNAGPCHGRRVIRAAELFPRLIHRHDRAPGIQDRDMRGEGLKARLYPAFRRVSRVV